MMDHPNIARVLGDNHLDTLMSARHFGVRLTRMGKLADATALYR
jgi:hypothetical protein